MAPLILISIIAVLSGISYFSIKGNFDKKIEIKDLNLELDSLMDVMDKASTVENKKTEIRNKQSEKESDILNNDNFNNGVMPINATKKNGSYRDRGRKSNSSNG